ncbi:hypothetical protein BDZ89DRAFT_1073758 [Hymenopellis radicata]|nr:hypothetical protein BDZ89DRAFT_1073758 [Hymenopellis radicata]
MSPNIKLSRCYTSYKSSPSQETLGIIGGVLPDGRPRSSNPRYIYTAPDLIGLVPSFNDKERIMSCIPVPQPRLPETGPLPMPSISFAPDSALQVEGVPLSDCLARQGMRDLGEAAFKEEMDEVRFLLCWPGYEHFEWLITIHTRTSQGDVISRGELAEIIAGQYEEFIQVPAQLHCTDPNWLIGPGLMGSTFDEMYLCSFWTPGDGFWRASMSVKKDITDEWHFAKERREREESQSTSGDQGQMKGKKRSRRAAEEEKPTSELQGPQGWQPSATADSLVDQLFGLDEE